VFIGRIALGSGPVLVNFLEGMLVKFSLIFSLEFSGLEVLLSMRERFEKTQKIVKKSDP